MEVKRSSAEMATSDLRRMATADAKLVVSLASRSKNLKGTFQKAFKNAAASMQAIVAALASRQQS